MKVFSFTSVSLVVAVLALSCSVWPCRGQEQESPASVATPPEIDRVDEAMQQINSSREAALTWAKAQLRKSSGTWKPPGSVEKTLHDMAADIVRGQRELGNFIAELERERATATTESDPPLTQVLAGLYGYQNKAAMKRNLFLEAWRRHPEDPWLNLKVAEEFHLTNQPEQLIQALNLVWEQAPEMILYEAGRVGSWYAYAGRLDGLHEALTRLESRKPPLQGGAQWEKFLTALRSGKLSPEQLEPVQVVVMNLMQPVDRPRTSSRIAAALMNDQKYSDAYDIYSKEIFFIPEFATKGAADTAAGSLASYQAVLHISRFVDAAVQCKRLDDLEQDARKLLELSAAWKQVGEMMLAAIARRRKDESPLIQLAQRLRQDLELLPADIPQDQYLHQLKDGREVVLGRQLAAVLQQELFQCDSRSALQLCLEWKQADEPRLVATGVALGMLRHEQALLHKRLGSLAEARKAWLSAVAAPRTAQELQALNISADQLRLNGFYEDALPLYRQLLHDWLPAESNAALRQNLQEVSRQNVGLILEQLREKWSTFPPEQQRKLLEALIDMLFADGRDVEPILPIRFGEQPAAQSTPESNSLIIPLVMRPDMIPELAPSVLHFASVTKELPRLRAEWADHPGQDSVALLTLRAEAAALDSDANELKQLMKQLERIEEESGQTPVFWSIRCLLQGLSESLQEACEFDFHDRRLDRNAFDLSGQSPWLVKPEAEGLRVRLPPNTGAIGHVGVKTLFQIHGDFEAIASYEILKIDAPVAPQFYGGAMLIAEFSGSAEHANIRRERHANGQDFYTPHHHSLSPQEQALTLMNHIPTKATKGQLALVRRGSTMHWLAKEEGESDFRLLQQDACGTQDIAALKLAIDSWGTQSLTDIRWLDVTIRAEKLLNLPAEYLRQPHDVAVSGVSLPATPTRRWLWWVAALIVLAPSAFFAIRRMRT